MGAPDINSLQRMEFDLSKLSRFPVVSIDTETTGLYWYRDNVFGIALAGYDPEQGVMMSGYFDIREQPRMVKNIQSEVKKAKRIVNHNIKFDYMMLQETGIILPEDRIECTSVRAAAIFEHEQSYSLDYLADKYIGMGKYGDIYGELAAMFGGKADRSTQAKNFHRAPVELMRKYAVPDAELACLLWQWQEGEIEKQDLHRVWDLERRLLPVLLRIEKRGVRVDMERTESARHDIEQLISRNQKELDKAAGKPLNANSPKQMRELFGTYKGEDGVWRTKVGDMALEATDSGNPSIDADALRSLAERGHNIAKLALDLRKSTKALSFLKDHIAGHEVGGRVYPNYNQMKGDNDLGTGTGRFSINDPAMQQIPSRDVEIARIVRACFIPEDNHDWVCADWEQFEYRWFAHYANDPNILAQYEKDPSTDFHQVVADMTGIPRKPRFAGDANAKQINLGMVFGMGEGTLAMEMGLPFTTDSRGYRQAGPEAKEVFAKYHSQIPGVKKLLQEASSIAKNRGYVMTKMYRHIRFPGGKFTHKAGGLIFQGTSADCMKQKMIEMDIISRQTGYDMLLSVHDELDFSVPKELTPVAMKEITECLQAFREGDAIHCRVPILSDVTAAENWFEASK
jgi:DNA polymerase I-like protein with 3'-5' exonuclease and polymerase domains